MREPGGAVEQLAQDGQGAVAVRGRMPTPGNRFGEDYERLIGLAGPFAGYQVASDLIGPVMSVAEDLDPLFWPSGVGVAHMAGDAPGPPGRLNDHFGLVAGPDGYVAIPPDAEVVACRR